MSEPDLLQQQREIFQRFRAANQQRIQTESIATTRRQTEQTSADSALDQAHQAAKAQLTQLIAEAETRYQTEHQAADELLDTTRKTAPIQLAQARLAHTKVQATLSRIGLHSLLEQSLPTSPTTHQDANAGQELNLSASRADMSAQDILSTSVAFIEHLRIAAGRRWALFWVTVALLIVGIFWGLSSYTARQTHYAQATATVVAQTTATVLAQVQATVEAQAQATATVLAPQAQAMAIALGLEPTHLRINPVDGANYVSVPAGEFMMGSPEGTGDPDEHPQSKISLSAFWIGQTEVTNAQYHSFINAGGYDKQALWSQAGWEWRARNNITHPGCWEDAQWNDSSQPVVCISWYEAMAYTAWLSSQTKLRVRLPTEAEWEKAARGTDGHIYPWGDASPNDKLLNFHKNVGKTSRGSAYSKGMSPYGAWDMAGNVSEWTSSRYIGYPYNDKDGREDMEGKDERAIRGGSWNNNPDLLRDGVQLDESYGVRTAYRSKGKPGIRQQEVGFRVVVAFP